MRIFEICLQKIQLFIKRTYLYNVIHMANVEDDNMDYLKAFLVGGMLCLIGQILIDKTKLTPARILVSYVVLGVILAGVNFVLSIRIWPIRHNMPPTRNAFR